MFSNDLFSRYLLLLFYFDYNIRHTECSLLSRAKNPINILTEVVQNNADKDVFYELPRTIYRTDPIEEPQEQGEVSATDVSGLPEYVLNRNEPIRTSSPTVNIYHYEAKKPSLLDSENINRHIAHRTFSELDHINRYKPERTMVEPAYVNYYVPMSTITRTKNFIQYEPLRSTARMENINEYQALSPHPALNKINRYEPLRTSADPQNVRYYEPLRTIPATKDVYLPTRSSAIQENLNRGQPLRTSLLPTLSNKINRYESVRTIPVSEKVIDNEPMRSNAVTEFFNPFILVRTSPASDNNYEPVRSSPHLDNYYNYEPSRTSSSTSILNRLDALQNVQLKRNLSRGESVRTYPSLEKIYRYEIERFTLPVNVYPYEPVRSSLHENSTLLQDIYKLKPSRTLTSPEYFSRYKPIQFSALYLDETSWPTKIPLRNLNASTSVIYQYVPLRTEALPKYSYRLKPSRSTTDNFFKPVAAVLPTLTAKKSKQAYQFTPFLSYRSSESLRKQEPFSPFLISITSKAHVNQWLPVNTTKSPDDYWSEFIRNEPERTSQAQDNLIQRWPTKSTVEVYRNKALNTLIVDGNVYQLLPLESTRGPDEYWNEFIRNEPQRTFGEKQTVPLRMSSVRDLFAQLPSRTSKLAGSLYQHEPLRTSRLEESFYNVSLKSLRFDQTELLRTLDIKQDNRREGSFEISTPGDYLYQNKPSRSSISVGSSYQTVPLRTSYPEQDIYLRASLRTSTPRDNLYRHDPVRTSRLTQNVYLYEPLRSSRPVASSYSNEHPRTFRPEQNIYLREPLRTSTLVYNSYKSIPQRTFRLTQDVYRYEPLRTSRPDENSYKNAHQRTSRLEQDVYQHKPLRTSTKADYLYQSGPVRTLSPDDLYHNEQLRTLIPEHNLYQQEPLRTSIPSAYLYPFVPLRTYKTSESFDQNEPLRMPILPQNYNLSEIYRTLRPPQNIYQNKTFRTSIPSQNMYQNVPSRTSILAENFYQNIPSKTSRPQDYYEHSGYNRTSSLGDYFYPVQPTRSSTSAAIFFQAQSFSSSSDIIIQSKVRQGFRTLWQPTVSRISKKTPTRTTLDDLKPTRTTKLFNWNFNDADAAWPKVELIPHMSTTERSTAPTTPKKSFATYFPFYLRTLKETTAISTTVRTTKTQTKTNVTQKADKMAKAIDDKDDQYMKKMIARSSDNSTRCYSCGLHDPDIPFYPSCFHIFDAPGSVFAVKTAKYRVHCKNPEPISNDTERRKRQPKVFDVPQKRRLYRGGCFKRFVEFGEVFSERGCRTLEPFKGKSFASLRLAVLERSLWAVDDGCVVSPHASLTPFARGVSLYARYHVCVCQGRYCNHGAIVTPSVSLIFFNILLSI